MPEMEHNDGKENLTFHYSREERLIDAPLIVKKAYSGELPQPPRGFFKALVHTKGSRFMLIALAFTLVITTVIIMTGPQDHIVSLSGIKFTMTAFSFNESIYISLKTEGSSEAAEGELIHLSFSFKDKDGIEVQKQEFSQAYSKKSDFIRTTVTDYDILSVQCTLTVGTQSETIVCKVEEK
jgi:hypothetical protein